MSRVLKRIAQRCVPAGGACAVALLLAVAAAAQEPAPAPPPAPLPAAAPRAAEPAVPAGEAAEALHPNVREGQQAALATPPSRPLSWFHRHQHRGQQAMVVAANPMAVDAGIEILAKGGKAIDAAVAVQAMLGLVEPQSSGIGGGAFLMYYDAHSGKLTAFDGREQAPAEAPADMLDR